MIQRSSIPARLGQKFFNDYKAVMKHYGLDERIELTTYLLNVFNIYIAGQEKVEEKTVEMQSQLEKLKRKYGRNFKVFRSGQLHMYFQFNIVLLEKGIYTTEEYNNMKNAEEQSLNKKEIRQFLTLCQNGLRHELDACYLQLEPEEPQNDLEGAKTRKGKVKREDNLTMLNQEQSALLIHYLQKAKIFLKDEYLNNKQAGEAISMLTGYSAGTLRQALGKKELERIKQTRNLTDVINALNRTIVLIEKEIREKKTASPKEKM